MAQGRSAGVTTFLNVMLWATAVGIALWTAGALYYDLAGGRPWGRVLAVAWLVAVVGLFSAWQPTWQPFLFLLVVFAGVLVWWFGQKPRNDRDWEPAVAVLPRATVAGDVVTIENVRNFEYRTLDDCTPRYDTRTYHLSNVRGVDIIFFNWGSRLMSHPVLVFDFGVDGRICMSIEVRYRRGQPYSILASLYRQYELIFVAADERDAILRRTKYGPSQEALLYPMVVGIDVVRAAFLDYVATINDMYKRPRWYHGLCTNCTTSFYRLPSSRRRWDWRVLINAHLDRALYDSGRLDRSLPFEQLREAARINDMANAAPAEGFGDYVRKELERRRDGR
jgi:hypothetical protein